LPHITYAQLHRQEVGAAGTERAGAEVDVNISCDRHLRALVGEAVQAVGAQSGARGDLSDPELAGLVRRWANLPAAVRAGIIAMVRSVDST